MGARSVGPRGRRRLVAGTVAVMMGLAACTGGGMEEEERATRTTRLVSFDGRGGDAWAWEEAVAGRADCSEVALEVNGDPVDGPVTTDGDRFTATVPLGQGENQIVARCGSAEDETSAPLVFTERLVDRPTARIRLSLRGGAVVADASGSRPAEVEGAALHTFEWTARDSNPARMTVTAAGDTAPFAGTIEGSRIRVTPPSRDGEYYITLRVADLAGREDRSTAYFVVEGGAPRLVDGDTENPAWVDRAVVYGVIPPLFGNDGFTSVRRRLGYLEGLGVNAVWLSPINSTPPGDFGYAVTDYFGLNPDYGTKDDFKAFVRAAHEHGIRVLMDFVPNHTSEEHPYFRDAQRYGEASHYYEFYDRRDDGTYTHYFDWTYLPNLNYDNREVRRMMLEAFSYWVREFDVDGFRVDVSWGVKRRRPSFWPEWRAELKRIKPDLLLLAEASARDPYYFSHGFDVAYDWTEDVGHWAWQGVFDAPEVIGEWLDSALTNDGKGYAEDGLIFRFMNNNDTETRFRDRYGTGITRVAAAMLLTLPGVPLIYTGDEIGASYLPYSNLTPLVWEDRFDLRGYYRKLIATREAVPALTSRRWLPVDVSPASMYSYVRYGEGSDPPVLVVLNYGARGTADLSRTPKLGPVLGSGAFSDALTGRRVQIPASGPIRVPMAAHSALVLVAGGPTR